VAGTFQGTRKYPRGPDPLRPSPYTEASARSVRERSGSRRKGSAPEDRYAARSLLPLLGARDTHSSRRRRKASCRSPRYPSIDPGRLANIGDHCLQIEWRWRDFWREIRALALLSMTGRATSTRKHLFAIFYTARGFRRNCLRFHSATCHTQSARDCQDGKVAHGVLLARLGQHIDQRRIATLYHLHGTLDRGREFARVADRPFAVHAHALGKFRVIDRRID